MEKPTLGTILQIISQHKGLKPKTEEYNNWSEMFKQYNEDLINRPLGMGCPPCYIKVYEYIEKQDRVAQ